MNDLLFQGNFTFSLSFTITVESAPADMSVFKKFCSLRLIKKYVKLVITLL